MAYHTEHEDSHHSGLADDCHRCKAHAEDLFSLDADNMLRIWSGTIITKTDMVAYNNKYRAVNQSLGLLDAISRLNGDDWFRTAQKAFYDHGGKA